MPNTAPDVKGAGAYLHVAAAVVAREGRILIARRSPEQHQGGLWEFPGGKVEPGETVREALARELREEVGIEAGSARPLIQIYHCYPDKRVLLDVWRVDRFTGQAHGREGQPVHWVTEDELPNYHFPAANGPIVAATRLPDRYLITPDPGPRAQWPRFLEHLSARLNMGVATLVQLRATNLSDAEYRELAARAVPVVQAEGARVLLNADPALASDLGADGVHLNGNRLARMTVRPLDPGFWVGASCHNAEQLRHAAAIGCDFALLSPVQATASHPDVQPLGWEGFGDLVKQMAMPVYGLGGLGPADLPQAWAHGAQGIAAIRSLWEDGQ